MVSERFSERCTCICHNCSSSVFNINKHYPRQVYPDPVRVISVGPSVKDLIQDPKKDSWRSSSVEFCGGTHLSNTKEAVAFVLTEETAVAKG
jgi:alanyl-tRNA synthetase